MEVAASVAATPGGLVAADAAFAAAVVGTAVYLIFTVAAAVLAHAAFPGAVVRQAALCAVWVTVPLAAFAVRIGDALTDETLLLVRIASVGSPILVAGLALAGLRSGAPSARFVAAVASAAPVVATAALYAAWLALAGATPADHAGTAALAALALVLSVVLAWARGAAWSLAVLVLAAAWLGPRAAAAPTAVGAGIDAPAGPHCVVLLTVDTLRADVLGHGSTGSLTPSIDGLLRDSVSFDGARAAAPWTKPAFASMFTGLDPFAHGVTTREARLPHAAETLAERLAAAGYATAAIGDNPFLRAQFGFDQGFAHYDFYPRAGIGRSFGARLLRRLDSERFGRTTPSSTELTGLAVRWLRDHGAKPFFLWLHYLDPHLPYEPPPAYAPPTAPPAGMDASFDDLSGVRAGYTVLDRDGRDWVRALYDGEVRYVDSEVGRFLDALREQDLYDRCVIGFASDHGEEFWEHGGFEHGHSVFDEVLRVPLAFKAAGATAGPRIADPVSTASLSATLLDLAGLEHAVGEGEAPSLAGASVQAGSAVVSGGVLYFNERAAVVAEGWKYHWSELGDEERLFDLARDPGETRSHLDADAERARRFRQRLDAARTRGAETGRQRGLGADAGLELDRGTTEQLRALGYVQ